MQCSILVGKRPGAGLSISPIDTGTFIERVSRSDGGAAYVEGSPDTVAPAGVSAGQTTQVDEHLHDTEPPLVKVLRKPYQPTREEIDYPYFIYKSDGERTLPEFGETVLHLKVATSGR